MNRCLLSLVCLYLFTSCEIQSNNASSKEVIKVKETRVDETKKKSQRFSKIEDYTILIASVKNAENLLTLRKFKDSATGQYYCLLLDVNTLNTKIAKFDDLVLSESIHQNNRSIYYEFKKEVSESGKRLLAGINKISKNGYVLTMDLCPSTKKMDKDFFTFLLSEKLSPLYVCITGGWIEKHKNELAFLTKENADKNIIWVNHSYNHFYDPQLKNKDNFMLNKSINVFSEVINNEIIMLENGLIPSPFFRFPGLVSDEALTKKILSYGLIPIGSNAWIAKGEKIQKGSIVLLHLNGNERKGLNMFLDLYKKTDLKPVSITAN
jgi:hypothetical protein